MRAAEVRAIPSVQCAAHSHSTGEQCKRFATPGASVCRVHGSSAPNVLDAAGRRVTLATLLARDPRSPWLVLRDVLHDSDSVYLEARRPLVDGEPMSPEMWDRYTRALERAAHLAYTTIRSQAYERWLAVEKTRVEIEATSMAAVLRAVTVPLVRALHLDAGDEDEVQLWAGKALAAALRNVSDGARDPDDVASGIPPVPLANLTSARGNLAIIAGEVIPTVLAVDSAPDVEPAPVPPWPSGTFSPTNPPPPTVLRQE